MPPQTPDQLPVFIRTASPADIPSIHALFHETWMQTYGTIHGPAQAAELFDRWHSIAELEKRLVRPDGEFVVADDGQQLAGFVFAFLNEKTVDLQQLYVAADRLGQGIGHLLFEEIVHSFQDAKRMTLLVDPGNERAIRFYEGLGFDRTGRSGHCGCGGDDIEGLVFELDLMH